MNVKGAVMVMKSGRVLKGGRKRGGASPYRKGYALEMRVKTKLVALGWSVTRAGGSHGTDLVAAQRVDRNATVERDEVTSYETTLFSFPRLVYISVKSMGEIPPHERVDLTHEAKKAGAECYVIDGKYRVRDVSEWTVSDWQELKEVF